MTELEPIIGNWYRHLDKGQTFRVVAVDEEQGIVEVQHFDGDIEEIDTDGWAELDLEAASEPEDWTGPVDDVETDDIGYSETDMEATDWKESLQEGVARGGEEKWEEAESGEEDEWGDEDLDWGESGESPDRDDLEEDD